jgi:hypothetical protein
LFFPRLGDLRVLCFHDDAHDRLGVAGANVNPAFGQIKPAAITSVEGSLRKESFGLMNDALGLLPVRGVF